MSEVSDAWFLCVDRRLQRTVQPRAASDSDVDEREGPRAVNDLASQFELSDPPCRNTCRFFERPGWCARSREDSSGSTTSNPFRWPRSTIGYIPSSATGGHGCGRFETSWTRRTSERDSRLRLISYTFGEGMLDTTITWRLVSEGIGTAGVPTTGRFRS